MGDSTGRTVEEEEEEEQEEEAVEVERRCCCSSSWSPIVCVSVCDQPDVGFFLF